jgi:hypothetical protein
MGLSFSGPASEFGIAGLSRANPVSAKDSSTQPRRCATLPLAETSLPLATSQHVCAGGGAGPQLPVCPGSAWRSWALAANNFRQ